MTTQSRSTLAGGFIIFLLCTQCINATNLYGAGDQCSYGSTASTSTSTRDHIMSAFCPTPSMRRDVGRHYPMRFSNEVTITDTHLKFRASTIVFAKPGMSEENARMERENEIRMKMAKLKSEGKMKNKDGTQSAADSAMLEAEQFFNRESPLKKFERSVAERNRLAAPGQEALDAEDTTGNE